MSDDIKALNDNTKLLSELIDVVKLNKLISEVRFTNFMIGFIVGLIGGITLTVIIIAWWLGHV